MENQPLDICNSWPFFEAAAGEEGLSWFHDQQQLGFSGCSQLNWEAEVLKKEDAFEAVPSMGNFLQEPHHSSMDVLLGNNSMSEDDWYNCYYGGLGVLDDLSLKASPNFDMAYYNREISGRLKDEEEGRFLGGGMVEEMKEERKQVKRCRAESGEEIYEDSNEKKSEKQREDKSISFNELSQYFYMPITQAAKEMNVGLTLLKKRCRDLGIPRWPHRKMKSLQTLIKNVQELGRDDGELGEEQLRTAIEVLEQQRRLMEKLPAMEIGEKTKKLRQACFKANYKKKKLLGMVDIRPSNYLLLQDYHDNGIL
ncbi:hypothetical protein ACLOJK_029090 [Asimina triloba]